MFGMESKLGMKIRLLEERVKILERIISHNGIWCDGEYCSGNDPHKFTDIWIQLQLLKDFLGVEYKKIPESEKMVKKGDN